jgi:predicted NACHT family NTPase
MVDILLAAWGAVNVTGFIFKPILEKLANLAIDALEDYVKDFFGFCIKDLVDLAKEFSLKKAFGKAIKEFLGLVQQELEDLDIESQEYTDALEKFLHNQEVLKELGKPFQKSLGTSLSDVSNLNIDTAFLVRTWHNLSLHPLPEDFNWQRLVKRYVKKIDYILQDSDELSKLFDSQNLLRIRESVENLAPISPDFDLSRYRQGLLNSYKRLDLDSLDTESYKYDKLELWKVFVPQNLCEKGNQSADIFSVLDILNQQSFQPQNHQYTVILGNPGSGKSTLSRYKVLEWARTPSNYSELQELPLLIELRNYFDNSKKSNYQNFLEYFHRGTGVRGGNLNQKELNKYLENHPSIVIFDGLDEILEAGEREKIVIDIINFTTNYPQARVLVTSRIVGYEQQRGKFRDANFRHFMLQDLNLDQIRGFVTKWHEFAFEDEHERNKKCQRLLNRIDKFRTFGELAGNPLLLTMMAILNRNEDLPRDRVTLYERASEVLLHKWDNEKQLSSNHKLDPEVYNFINYKDKLEMLCSVAHKMQESDSNLANQINENILEKTLSEYLQKIFPHKAIVAARGLLEVLTSRSFILCFLGDDAYGFVHRTFLEYFCAKYFIDQFHKEQTITPEKLQTEVLIKHWTNEAWREVIILITSEISENFTAEFIDYLLQQTGENYAFANLILAAECLRNIRKRPLIKETEQRLLDKVKNLLEHQPKISEELRNRFVEVIQTTWKDDTDALLWLEALTQ